ncbi:hypothetical protein [Leekyejoonella antrihumi]|uniref:Tat pathway signal sequence domain protein n=1 Tax=Leekyejoonella antrihumi TaxID=1660198 RepID=A0A563E742_9MICO|nr:hypothetical protein [Leekyejoonella antrihumi]TWP38336.1 hypothetical protein FGL98_03765 [Leekyejoonella antrihumi]
MTTRRVSLPRALTGVVAAGLLSAVPMSPSAAAPTAAAPPSTHAPGSVGQTRGTIVVQLDPSTMQAVPAAQGTRYRLSVRVTLELSGTVDGKARGVTVATVDAPCAAAISTPPGTFADTFRFTGGFHGTVSGIRASADLEYAGVTRVGGAVSALLVLHNGAAALATVQARAGDSGTYRGMAVLPSQCLR